MGRIRGHYEWDDDGLNPGYRRGGGLHQNLFDSNGKLQGSARFVPDDDSVPGHLVVTETVYVPVEQRRLSREEEELRRAITDLLVLLIDVGISKGRPLAQQWWRDQALPIIGAKRADLRERRSRRKSAKWADGRSETDVEPSHDIEKTSIEKRPRMSRAEAQARFLAALAARVRGDEQMRLIARADIVDCESLAELQRSLHELPSDQVKVLIEQMVRDPLLLGDAALADLASILGRRALKR